MSVHARTLNLPILTPKNVDVCHAARLQRHLGSARTLLGPITLLIMATMFATQPVCNATRAAHALRLDQNNENRLVF
jgi:hypothetical protein